MYKCPVCKKYFKKGDLNHAHDESKNLSNTPDKNDDKEPEVHKQLTGTGSDFEQRPKDMENNEPNNSTHDSSDNLNYGGFIQQN